MSWRTTDLSTNPAAVQLATTELVALAFDASLDLDTGEAVTSATTRLIRLDTLATVALDDAPDVDTNVLTQMIDGSDLTRGVDYELAWTFVISATKVLSRTTVLSVVA
jgi:hypothetical protein